MLKKSAKFTLMLLWLLLLVTIIYKSQIEITRKAEFQKQAGTSFPPLTDLKPLLVNIITLGHKSLYDDFIHIWMLQLLGHINIDRSEQDHIHKAIVLTMAQRPKIESFYLLSCFVMTLHFDKPQACQDIAIAGMEVFSKSWRIPMMQGYIHAFELHQPAQAALFYSLAASRENAPAYVTNVANRLVTEKEINQEDLMRSFELMFQVAGGDKFKTLFEKALQTHKEQHNTNNTERQM